MTQMKLDLQTKVRGNLAVRLRNAVASRRLANAPIAASDLVLLEEALILCSWVLDDLVQEPGLQPTTTKAALKGIEQFLARLEDSSRR